MGSEVKRGKIPLYRLIGEEIRRGIISGIYLSGEILPSIREEARILGVARNTVDAAYQMLAEEGYIKARRGIGYEVLDYEKSFNFDMNRTGTIPEFTADRVASETAKLPYNFLGGIGPFEEINVKKLKQFTVKLYNEIRTASESSDPELRREIHRYLKRHRGVTCSDEQIYLCRDLYQAVQMIRKVQPHVLYTIPHHEGAMGNHISWEEEHILRQRLREKDICMIEDDIDSELVYGKRPYVTLFEGDTEQRVILTGTFERILGNLIPMQYIVFPSRIAEKCRQMNGNYGQRSQHSMLELVSMKVIMQSENWESYLRRTNHKYAVKRDILLGKIKEKLGEDTILYRTESGTEIIAAIRLRSDVRTFIEKAKEAGLGLSARSGIDQQTGESLLYITLNYSHISNEKIGEGINVLAAILGGAGCP